MAELETDILRALFGRVATIPGGTEIVYPDMVYPAEAEQARADTYILVTHSPNNPLRWGIDPEAHQYRGVLSLALLTKLGLGAENVSELSGTITAHFPADLELRSGSVALRLPRNAHAVGGYRDGDRWRTPIVVEYESVSIT